MTIDTVELGRLLTFAGLVVGAAAYFTLIRRRRRDADEVAEMEREASQRRATARFRHLRRRDDR